MIVTYLGLAYGPYSRARRPRPSEKIGFRVISGLSALVDPCWAGLAAKGRALHAREQSLGRTERCGRRTTATRLPISCNQAPRYVYGPATRTRRAHPSAKFSLRMATGRHPARRFVLGLAPPRRGGLCTSGKEGLASTGGSSHDATGRSFAPHGHVMPRLAYGLAMRTRRPRPSEKTTLRVISGLSPLGHPSSDSPPRGGAGSAGPQ